MRGFLPATLMILAIYSACATQDEAESWDTQSSANWHQRYVADNCARCPECCVEVTENGFIDPYGVERPNDWLPDDEDDSAYCRDCPSPDCICVQDGSGRWWINATLGDDD